MNPEEKLWKSVLMQAFNDAESYDMGIAIPARKYLCAIHPTFKADLRLVCSFADFGHPDKLIQWARNRYGYREQAA